MLLTTAHFASDPKQAPTRDYKRNGDITPPMCSVAFSRCLTLRLRHSFDDCHYSATPPGKQTYNHGRRLRDRIRSRQKQECQKNSFQRNAMYFGGYPSSG